MPHPEAIKKAIDDINTVWTNPPARNGRFGNILKSIDVKNVRGLTATVEFSWPLTVIGGVNGCGKTTLIQLCSSAYAKPGGRYFKIGDWLRNGLVGETPAIVEPAAVKFTFWDDTASIEIPYIVGRTRWDYPRRKNPMRNVEFVGISNFSPRIERRDRVHAFQMRLHVTKEEKLEPRVIESVSRILGTSYTRAQFNEVRPPDNKWKDELPQISRASVTYGEPHMGAGEQKVVRLVRFLESLPKKSLVLLEEPEITLHPDAQRGLAWYLMALCNRRGHQIIVATHSAEMFETLPADARVLIVRSPSSTQIIHRPPHLRAARELAGSVRTNQDLILVEDDVGRVMMREVLRRFDKGLLEQSRIVAVGNTDDVARLVGAFRTEGVRAVGVRDADIGEDPASGLFSLPDAGAPEALLLSPANLARAEALINGIQKAFETAEPHGLGHEGTQRWKRIYAVLPSVFGLPAEVLTDRLTLAWLEANQDAAKSLAERIVASFETTTLAA
jgi:predicted ATPase